MADKEKKPVVKTESPIENRISSLEAKVGWLIRKLEKQFGIDINQDGKIGFGRISAVFGLICLLYVGAVAAVNIVNYPTNTGGTGMTLDDSGNLTVGGTLGVTGTLTGTGTIGAADLTASDDLTVTDDVTIGGIVTATGVATAIATNAYEITPTGSVMLLNPSLVTTCTVANATSAGQILHLINVGANNAVISDASNTELTGAITLGQWDALSLISGTTSNWVQISTSNN